MILETGNQSKLHSERQLQLSKSSQYIKDFLDARKDPSFYKHNSCPTCGIDSTKFLFKKNSGEYSYCQNCEHIYLSKSLSSEHLLEFYTNYPTSSLDWHLNESDFYTRVYNSGLDMIQESKSEGSILDIGCSSGFFLSIASQRGYIPTGVEPNKQEASFAVKNGINVVGNTISDLSNHQKFDVITLWDVLEHIDSPSEYIHNLKSYLNPGGLIFVQVPTCDSLAARVMREKSNMFDGIEHLTLFSRKSLNICFANSSFVPLNSKSIISDSFALTNYLSYESDPYLPSNTSSEFFSILDKLIDFDSIESAFLGYKIQACYQVHHDSDSIL